MNKQIAGQLKHLSELTEFAKQHAFNNADEMTAKDFIADQFLRRSTEMADDFALLIDKGHELNASIIRRAMVERLTILEYLEIKNEFKEFEQHSMASEYQALQHITSEPRMGEDSRHKAEHRKKEIRQQMGGEPRKPGTYWHSPKNREALEAISHGHPNTNVTQITSYQIPSSAIHVRHNDAEPTGILIEPMVKQVTSHMAAIIMKALLIAENMDGLGKLKPLITRLYPE